MNHIDISTLMMYLHNQLSPMEAKGCKTHLDECQLCQNELELVLKMQKSFDNAPFLEHNTFGALQNRIEEKRHKGFHILQRVPIFSSLLIVFSVLFFILYWNNSTEKLILTRINKETSSYYVGKIFHYPLTIYTKTSFQQFQVGQSKAVYLYPRSKVKFKNNKIINLEQGTLLGKLFDSNQTKWTILIDGLIVKVIGTKFLIQKEKNATIVSVQYGHLQVSSKTKKYDVYDNTKLLYKNGKMNIIAISNRPAWYDISLNKASIIKNKDAVYVNFVTNEIIRAIGNACQDLKDFRFDFLYQYNSGSVIEMKPLLNKNMVFFGTIKGKIVGLNVKRGTIEWEDDISSRISSSPLIYDKYIILTANNGYTYFIHKSDGVIEKKIKTGVLAYASPIIINHNMILGNTEGVIHIIDLEKKMIVWKKKVNDIFYATPIEYEGMVFIPSFSGKIYKIELAKKQVSVFASTTGKFTATRGVIFKDFLFFLDSAGQLFAFDMKTGENIWTTSVEPSVVDLILLHDSLLVCSISGKIYVLDINTGQIIKTKFLSGRIMNSPNIEGDYIFIANSQSIDILDSQTLKKINSIKGKISNMNFNDKYLIAIDKDGFVYIYKKEKL